MPSAAEAHPGLGILHVDAHADLRESYEGFRWSHASIMDNVLRELPGVERLVQIGIRDFASTLNIGGAEGVNLTITNGQGAFVSLPSGIAGLLSADATGTVGGGLIETIGQDGRFSYSVGW